MSKQKNLAAIGVFVVTGTILAVGGIIALASGNLFSPKLKAVTYFNESVAGLNVGAPTKFQGVVIGKVTKISFAPNLDSLESYIRVEAEIDVALTRSLGATDRFDRADQMAQSIREGLRASLATESMVTGIRYIEIQYVRDAPEPIFLNKNRDFLEIPSTPSPFAGLTQSVTEVVARFGAVDLPALAQNITEFLEMARQRAEALDVKALNDQMLSTLKAGERAFSNERLSRSLETLDETLVTLRDLAVSLKEQSLPTFGHLDSAAVALSATLAASQDLLKHTISLLSPEGSFRYETETALKEMGKMARALRRLADELERNPGAVIRGKSYN